MIVADLIKALQALPPDLPVTAFVPVVDGEDEGGMFRHEMTEAEAAEVTDVRFTGRCVVLEAGGMIR